MKKHYKIQLKKEALKFSAAHVTVFPDGTKESLHGHNFSTELVIEIEDVTLSHMIDFSIFKKAAKNICERWDEKFLLATDCPFLKVLRSDKKEHDFELCGKHYVIPTDEIVFLKTDNIIAETLADAFLDEFKKELFASIPKNRVLSIEVKIFESPGLGASSTWLQAST